MIEVFNTDRTVSLGCFVNFKAAKGTLDELASSGKLGKIPAVMVCSYKNDEPQQEYIATYSDGKWRVPKLPKVSVASKRTKRRHKKCLRKEYTSPEAMFNEGFPDWINRSYPVPSPKQQGMNVRRRIHAHC